MMGDTKGEADKTTTGVSEQLSIIAQKIASLNTKPDLVLVGGDLCCGDELPSDSPLWNYSIQFLNWKQAMKPVFDYSTNTGIPIYPVRGNHDNSQNEGATIPALKQAYYDAFSAYLPANGPNNGTNDNQVGFSYSFTHNNVTFAVADQYFYYNQTPGLEGYHDLDRAWVSQQFQQSSSPYKVFMAHEPFFMTVGRDQDEHFFGTNSVGLLNREDFWNALGTNGVQLYLTGHVHNESIASTTNDYGNTIIQLMEGTGGASLFPLIDKHDPGVDVLHTNDLFGFSLATVSDTSMTIQYYSLHTNDNSWTVSDYVTSISPNQEVPEASTAVLLAPALAVLTARGLLKRRRS